MFRRACCLLVLSIPFAGEASHAFLQENYLNDPTWKEIEALHKEIQADIALSSSLRLELAADFEELRAEINELQKRSVEFQQHRTQYEADGKEFVRKVEAHNAEVAQFDSASSAHAGSDHECKPCGEYGRLGSWSQKLAARENELNKVKETLAQAFAKSEKARKELEEDAGDFAANGLTSYENELKRIKNKAAESKGTKSALQSRLESLRGQVAKTQEVLRTLIKTIQENNRGLEEWAKTSDQSLQDSYERARVMLADGLLDYLKSAKEARLDAVDRQIARKQQKLRKKKKNDEWIADIKTLKEERQAIESEKGLLERMEKAKSDLDAAMAQAKDAPPKERVLELVYSLGQEALKDEKIQRALRIGGSYAIVAGHAKTIVDTTYDVLAQLQSRERILQLNKSNEEILKAVDALSERIKKLVDQIVQIKKELGK